MSSADQQGVTTTKLTRAAGLCAVGAGLLFLGIQINHPHLDVGLVTTTEWTVRQNLKLLMAVLSLTGITGMYLRQVRQAGVLGLIGYLLFAAGYLLMISVEAIGGYVLPALATPAPGFVDDVLAVAAGDTPNGSIGSLHTLIVTAGIGYLAGGFVFGIALFRAGLLARWAAALLALGTLSTIAIPLLPQVNERLFAVPTGIALIGLGYSLWREQRAPVAGPVGVRFVPAGAE